MDFLARWFQRIIIGAIALLAIWLIVTQVFERLNERLPLFIALALTYVLSAYIILPRIVQIGLFIARRGRIPQVTRTADGMPADPVNIILIGSGENLIKAFEKAGWVRAEPLSFKTAWKMATAYTFNRPYPDAPFSSYYLFGRRQDYGFQEPIGRSPRSRHHIRFWAANLDPDADPADFKYWTKKHTVDPMMPLIWVGAGTEDLGIGLSALTYQVTHRTNKYVDEERDYIFEALRSVSAVTDERYVESNREVEGKYVSDGRILTATLVAPDAIATNSPASREAEAPPPSPSSPQA
jgi:hypothetical protein